MKQVRFAGKSFEDIKAFPEAARQRAGYQLLKVQKGEDPGDWKPVNAIGHGVKEIRIHVKGQYRVIYTAQFQKAIYVLHAFQKKTQKIAKKDIDIAWKRFNEIAPTNKG